MPYDLADASYAAFYAACYAAFAYHLSSPSSVLIVHIALHQVEGVARAALDGLVSAQGSCGFIGEKRFPKIPKTKAQRVEKL